MTTITVEDGNGNTLEQTVDHGDGTGTRTTYDPTGNVTSTEQIETQPPDPRELTREQLLAMVEALGAELAAVRTAMLSGLTTTQAAIDMPRSAATDLDSVNTAINYLGDVVRGLAHVMGRHMEITHGGLARTVAGFRVMVDQLDDPIDDDTLA